MGLLRRKPDPISEREREIKAKIASLEDQIEQLHHRIGDDQAQPKLRSTARPHGQAPLAAGSAADAPAFEEVSHGTVHDPEAASTAAHYNDLGLRKYDLAATLRRWLNYLRGAPTPNPRLVSYLAAGGIHGLRPLRYEKRVARRRFFLSLAIVAPLLLGAYWWFNRNR